MNIAVISEQLPNSSNNAGCPRLYHLFEALSKKHDISLITTAEPSSEDAAGSSTFLKEIITIKKPGKPTWARKQLHRLALAPHLLQKYRNPAYVSDTTGLLTRTLDNLQADVVYVHGIAMSQYIHPKCRIPVVLDLVDSGALLYRRTAQKESNLIRKFIVRLEAQSLANWEAKVVSNASVAITISPIDRQAILQYAPESRIEVVPNGVDFDFFHPGNSEEVNALVFTGVMSYQPNAQAATWFGREIFPSLRSNIPDLEYWVVGKDPSQQVMQLANEPGITVTGTVDDVRPYLEKGKIFISPLQFGSGMKNKILNAMAMRKAIIATPLSIEGIDVKNNSHLILADSLEQWTESVKQLIDDRDKRQRLAASGYDLVRNRYSWGNASKTLEEVFKSVVTTSP